jgi:hypothetical protein
MKTSLGDTSGTATPFKGISSGKEIAVGVSATMLFFFMVLFVPILGLFVGIFTPLPTLLFYYRWGPPFGYWVPGGSIVIGALLLVLLGMHQSLPYFLEMVALGVLLGAGMRRQWSVERVIGTAAVFVAALGMLGM